MDTTHAPMAGLQMLGQAMAEDPDEAFVVAVWLLTDLAVACAADELCRGWDIDG